MATGAESRLRPMQNQDAEAVLDIFREGIDTRMATFETQVPTWSAWDEGHLPVCRWVAVQDDRVLGWIALSAVSRRKVYAGVAESSLYIAQSSRGQGVGLRLLQHLIADSEAQGFWTLQAGIFPENTASLALHLKCGFRVVGQAEKIGRLEGQWKDVVRLERRSQVVGLD